MKNGFITRTMIVCCLALGACRGSGSNNGSTTTKALPKPGTVIASDEMPVAGDTLNHFKFGIKVVADSLVAKGIYDIDADFGPNFATGQMAMPKGGEDLTPILKRSPAPNTYIIGFRVPGDTTFYEYYEVSSTGSATRMQYIKSYTF
jgi:hypothetical protein